MDTNVIIANERAYWGLSRSRIRRALAFFDKHKYPFSLFKTDHPGHARELAAEAAAQNAGTIIVMGGDGTLNEVINGVLTSQCKQMPRIGIVPSGSSNDFSKTLGIGQRLQQACRIIINGKTRCVDIGQAGSHYFCIASCLGLFSNIAAESVRIKGLSGSVRYLAAAMKVVVQMNSGGRRTNVSGQLRRTSHQQYVPIRRFNISSRRQVRRWHSGLYVNRNAQEKTGSLFGTVSDEKSPDAPRESHCVPGKIPFGLSRSTGDAL